MSVDDVPGPDETPVFDPHPPQQRPDGVRAYSHSIGAGGVFTPGIGGVGGSTSSGPPRAPVDTFSSQLQPIDVLPVPFRKLFPYNSFNRVQTRCFHPAYYGDENMVVAAPTGTTHHTHTHMWRMTCRYVCELLSSAFL